MPKKGTRYSRSRSILPVHYPTPIQKVTPMSLESRIELILAEPITQQNRSTAQEAFSEILAGLNDGSIRSATKDKHGTWRANGWVKKGILLGFKLGTLIDYSSTQLPFFDKDTYPLKPLSISDNVRIVPGGSSIRTGCYVSPGVVCMPPMYINVGAYVDEGTLVDSHALVGSCAQIGKHVHVSAAVQIGGVLEPVGALPVIVEDNVFIGGGCGIYEGCILRERAVLAPGVTLTGATRVFDVVNDRILSRENNKPLEIPEGAVVVPGSRAVTTPFGERHGLSLYAPVIVKYRDAKTDASTSLEDALR